MTHFIQLGRLPPLLQTAERTFGDDRELCPIRMADHFPRDVLPVVRYYLRLTEFPSTSGSAFTDSRSTISL